MRVIVNRGHARHVPPHECENGLPTAPSEVPGRVASILAALTAHGGFTFEDAPAIAEEALFALHDADYVAFLRETSADLAQTGSPGFAIPTVFPYGPSP